VNRLFLRSDYFAEIRPSGELIRAELHWYEPTGIGRREMKIEAFI
jgi:hypothetical protein